MAHLLASFDQVRIINLVDRTDRRREISAQLKRVGGLTDNIAFFEAQRPTSCGGFESIGARGCFESHLSILRAARNARAGSVLIIEDDFDFTRDGSARARELLPELFEAQWDLFYGAHGLAGKQRRDLALVPSDEPIQTTSFVAFNGRVLDDLVAFLDGLLTRPPGSPDHGPMHVDGAYNVFRMLNPARLCLATFPPLGKQRSSASDVTPSNMLLDRSTATRGIANVLRRAHERFFGGN